LRLFLETVIFERKSNRIVIKLSQKTKKGITVLFSNNLAKNLKSYFYFKKRLFLPKQSIKFFFYETINNLWFSLFECYSFGAKSQNIAC